MTKSNDAERAIRSAARSLADAIGEGRKAGLAIAWPSRPEDLSTIAISETGKVAAEPEPAKSTPARPARAG
jgi:hypothetical protein